MRELIKRLIPVERTERKAVLLATAYGFCILLSYYILRPVRDEISSADRGNLQILWTAVFIVMLGAVPLYSAVVSKYSRGVFIPLANRFFAVNILGFFLALSWLSGPESRVWLDRVFYVWASVFALFVVTVFWGFIADLFRNRQGRRVFGFIAVGSSLGGIVGSLTTSLTAERLPPFFLLLLAVLPLEIAAQLARRLHAESTTAGTALRREGPERVPGTALSGIRTVFRSPYLRHIAAYLAIMTFASTVLYFQQAELVGVAITDRAARTAFYAKIDLWSNSLTIFAQAFVAAHVIRRFGVGVTLAMLPALSVLGFLTLGLTPLLAVLVTFQVLYRSARYSIARPAREVLFTVVGREERYKSKAFVDAAVYRGGDLVSGWIYAGLAWLGMTVGAIALLAVPVMLVWAGVGVVLGRRQEDLVRREDSPTVGEPTLGLPFPGPSSAS